MKGLRLVCSLWIVLFLVIVLIIILYGSADANEPADIIDGMYCVCVADVPGQDDCPGVWRWYLCFPDYPDRLPMVYRFTCDGTIADPPNPTPTMQPTLYPPFMIRLFFMPLVYEQSTSTTPLPTPRDTPTPAPTMQP